VAGVAALVSLAPWDAEGLDWYGGMTASNVRAYRAAELGQLWIANSFQMRSSAIKHDPLQLLHDLMPELASTDRTVVGDAGFRRQLLSTYRQAFQSGADGWIDDALAFTNNWGFKVESIPVPVRLWHGADDQFSPVEHSRWLADRIPGAELYLEPGAGHFGAFKALTEALQWAAETI
jgi:pimeloyl-ACP methyl ester carboxylesterase